MKKQILIGILFTLLIGIFVSCGKNTELISYDKEDEDVAYYYCKTKNDVISLLKRNNVIDEDFNWKEDITEMKDPLRVYVILNIDFLNNIDRKTLNEYKFRDGFYLAIDQYLEDCDSFYYLKFKKGIPVKVGNEYLNLDDCWYVKYGL